MYRDLGLRRTAVTIKQLFIRYMGREADVLAKYAASAQAAGAISKQEANQWLLELAMADRDERYSHAVAVLVVSCSTP